MSRPTVELADLPVVITFLQGSAFELGSQSDTGRSNSGPSEPGTTPSGEVLITKVILGDGTRIALPSEQVVHKALSEGAAVVGFSGMSFVALEEGTISFRRIRDLLPDEQHRKRAIRKLVLKTEHIETVRIYGEIIWSSHGTVQ